MDPRDSDPPLRIRFVPRLEDVPNTDLPVGHFTLLVAADVSRCSDAQVEKVVADLLARGMVELTCWGPDCERLHDLADKVIIESGVETDEPKVTIVTSWFSDEPVEEAAFFAATCAFPSEVFEETFVERLALVVGNEEWVAPIQRVFDSPGAYAEDCARPTRGFIGRRSWWVEGQDRVRTSTRQAAIRKVLEFGREPTPVHVAVIPDLEEARADDIPGYSEAVLVVGNYEGVGEKSLRRLANVLSERGFPVSFWGPGCSRVNEAFADVPRTPRFSTWAENESLHTALSCLPRGSTVLLTADMTHVVPRTDGEC